ncbi:unnamed protein product [Protopolystoma xenopodis]|uniref:Uncharacterized protein n=1 Tax=Protopolystoma xenopodis TaxID=117903 RepID=A0A3S5A9A7_9PLAT|nr:unnamed protein product [Protopolystoma xenopodis]
MSNFKSHVSLSSSLGFIQFVHRNVADTATRQLDCCLRVLYHLLCNWRLALQKDNAVSPQLAEKSALFEAEGFGLVMLCHCRASTRRLVVHILRECRSVLHLILVASSIAVAPIPSSTSSFPPVVNNTSAPFAFTGSALSGVEASCIDVMDKAAPAICRRLIPLLPSHERRSTYL